MLHSYLLPAARLCLGVIVAGALCGPAQAQPATAAPEITLRMDQTTYQPSEPVVVHVTYRNPSDAWQPWIGPVPGGQNFPLAFEIRQQQPDGTWAWAGLYRRFIEHSPRVPLNIGPRGVMTTQVILSDFYTANAVPGVYEVTLRHHPDSTNLAYARSNTVRYEVLPYESPDEAAVAGFVRSFSEGIMRWRGADLFPTLMWEDEIIPYVDSLSALPGLPRRTQAAMAFHRAWFLHDYARYFNRRRPPRPGSDTLSTSRLLTPENWQAAAIVAFDDVASRFAETHYAEIAALESPFFVEHFVYTGMQVEMPSAPECGGGPQVIRYSSTYTRIQTGTMQSVAPVQCVYPQATISTPVLLAPGATLAASGAAFRLAGQPHDATGAPVAGYPAPALTAPDDATLSAALTELPPAQRARLTGADPATRRISATGEVSDAEWTARLVAAATVTLPARPGGPVGTPEAPVVAHAPAGATLDGAFAGHGILVVDGPLVLRGNARWTGLVVARSSVTLAGAPRVVGAVVVGGHLAVGGSAEILYSPEALARAAALVP